MDCLILFQARGKKNEEAQEEDPLLQGIIGGDSRNIMFHLLVLGIRRKIQTQPTLNAYE